MSIEHHYNNVALKNGGNDRLRHNRILASKSLSLSDVSSSANDENIMLQLIRLFKVNETIQLYYNIFLLS